MPNEKAPLVHERLMEEVWGSLIVWHGELHIEGHCAHAN